jgi:hypothetical protein
MSSVIVCAFPLPFYSPQHKPYLTGQASASRNRNKEPTTCRGFEAGLPRTFCALHGPGRGGLVIEHLDFDVKNPKGIPTEESVQTALLEVAISSIVNRLVSAGSSS